MNGCTHLRLSVKDNNPIRTQKRRFPLTYIQRFLRLHAIHIDGPPWFLFDFFNASFSFGSRLLPNLSIFSFNCETVGLASFPEQNMIQQISWMLPIFIDTNKIRTLCSPNIGTWISSQEITLNLNPPRAQHSSTQRPSIDVSILYMKKGVNVGTPFLKILAQNATAAASSSKAFLNQRLVEKCANCSQYGIIVHCSHPVCLSYQQGNCHECQIATGLQVCSDHKQFFHLICSSAFRCSICGKLGEGRCSHPHCGGSCRSCHQIVCHQCTVLSNDFSLYCVECAHPS